MDSDVLDLLATISRSSASSYQKIAGFCQNSIQIEVESATERAPESLREVIGKVFGDFQQAMDAFCKSERYYMTRSSAWTTFYQSIKPPIDDTLAALSRETGKQAFQQRQKVLVSLSMEVIEALQDAQEFFDRETRKIEQSARLLQEKMERLVQETKAIQETIRQYPGLQKDPGIFARAKDIEQNCLAIIEAGNGIYQRSNPEQPHPPLSNLFLEEAEGRIEDFADAVSYGNIYFASNAEDSQDSSESWYLNCLEEYLPAIEANSKRGREIFTLLLEGIQQEFQDALATLRGVEDGSRLLAKAERTEAALTYDLLDDLALHAIPKKIFRKEAHNIAKTFADTAKQAAAVGI